MINVHRLYSNLAVLLTFALALLMVCATNQEDSSSLSLTQFQSILSTEINTIVARVASDKDQNRRLEPRHYNTTEEEVNTRDLAQAQELWKGIVHHGWEVYSEERAQGRLLQDASSKNSRQPFLLCSHSTHLKSAHQRLKQILKLTKSRRSDISVVRNDPKVTCFHIFMEYEVASRIRDSSIDVQGIEGYPTNKYTILPMTDLMKIQQGTFGVVSNGACTDPSDSTCVDWERSIRVGLSRGHSRTCTNNDDSVSAIAHDIIHNIRKMVDQNDTRRRMTSSSNTESKTIAQLFSLTKLGTDLSLENQDLDLEGAHSNIKLKPRRRLKKSQWHRALELGLEAEHSCEDMFSTMKINVHYCNAGFDVVINARNNSATNDGIEFNHQNDGIEEKNNAKIQGSALNKNCVISFIMALSTSPAVMSIEIDSSPILENDYESQWITQSKVQGDRPLHSLGIKGQNQVISVIDSGLDINHRYFGPTNSRVFEQWDFSQRKVVRYDHSVGDKVELNGGHGTKVAGAAAGKSNRNSDDLANGIAEDAKLHVFDIVKGRGSVIMPEDLTFKLFESMHSTDKFPARIANGSWNIPYSPYPTICRFFDKALHKKYQGDLYVASAGNDGLDENRMKSRVMTIGNPASCKNTLAVGASQSHGVRMPNGKGIDYLAAFSSRGPTHDGRIKPDLVAPGATVLTAYANEGGKTVQISGTSYSAPIVAGNAALVRQYFEEGHLPCPRDDCKIDPSGSLVKAVLINSARSLKKVQVARQWFEAKVLEELTEYDYNQGMGLIQLDNTLPIQRHNKIKAVVRNDKAIEDGTFQDIFIRATPNRCFGSPSKHEFSATLTWYDPEGAVNCAKCLINDLDIIVHAINANGSVRKQSREFPNGSNRKDYTNNVERVRFNMIGSRRYRIRVRAANLESAQTKYSLIASGCFKTIRDPSKRTNSI